MKVIIEVVKTVVEERRVGSSAGMVARIVVILEMDRRGEIGGIWDRGSGENGSGRVVGTRRMVVVRMTFMCCWYGKFGNQGICLIC